MHRAVRPILACVLFLCAKPDAACATEPVSATTVITGAIQLLKEINELNRGNYQGQQLRDIEARLGRIEEQLGRMEDKLDEAVTAIHRLEDRIEEQWEIEKRADILGAIRSINRYYPGWKAACTSGGKTKCDPETRAEIRELQTELVSAASRFMERDSYSNVHIAVLAMGYERDLLLLLSGHKHAHSVFTQYANYLEEGVAYLDELRARADKEARRLEKSAEGWATNKDWCHDNCNAYTYHVPEQLNCRYCAVVEFAGNLKDGWTIKSGFGVRDGQGRANCYDPNPREEPRGGREPRGRVALSSMSMSSFSCDVYPPPVEGLSCEYLQEHRNCSTLNAVIASRPRYLELTTQAIAGVDKLRVEVNNSVAFARDVAAGKLLLVP